MPIPTDAKPEVSLAGVNDALSVECCGRARMAVA